MVSFECLRSLTSNPPLQIVYICPSAVPQPQYECIVSKPQTLEAPSASIRCWRALLVASYQLVANKCEKKVKEEKNPKDFSFCHSTSLAKCFLGVKESGRTCLCYVFVYLNISIVCAVWLRCHKESLRNSHVLYPAFLFIVTTSTRSSGWPLTSFSSRSA